VKTQDLTKMLEGMGSRGRMYWLAVMVRLGDITEAQAGQTLTLMKGA